MTVENKVEYKVVSEKGDRYRRILVKFNPRFLRSSDFEIEFIPFKEGIEIGRVFVSEIDSMSTIDLYRWAGRQTCLMYGLGGYERGTIIPQKVNLKTADIMRGGWRQGGAKLEPRQIVSRVKRAFEGVAEEYSEPTAFAFNYFLFSGQLAALPYSNVYFTIERLKSSIEEISYYCKNANGEIVERPLVEHLFDTHKTEYITGAICNFLEVMCAVREEIIKEYGEKKNP